MSVLSRKLLKRSASIRSGWPPVDSSEVESTYVAKPRYHQSRKSRRLVKWFAYITSDLQRLTTFTLIVVLVCGVGTLAAINLLGSRSVEPVIIRETSATDHPSITPDGDLQSSTQDQEVPATGAISDGSAERSSLERKNDEGGPLQQTGAEGKSLVDNIEHTSRLPVVKPLPKSSERDDVHQKEATTRSKSIPSRNVVRAEEKPFNVKAKPTTFARKPPTINAQRPRRVAGKSDRVVPVATSDKNTKAKVIQWP